LAGGALKGTRRPLSMIRSCPAEHIRRGCPAGTVAAFPIWIWRAWLGGMVPFRQALEQSRGPSSVKVTAFAPLSVTLVTISPRGPLVRFRVGGYRARP